MISIGQTVDRFRVIRPLGGGATAEVFLVEHVDLDTKYALKVMSIAGTGAKRRTMREGKVQAKLLHPNIVSVRDVFVVGEMPALLMDFVDGPALDTLLNKYQPNLAQVDLLVRGILAGMSHAHDLGLVHRDIKPANVLLEPSGQSVIPRVADFGLVKLLDGDPDERKTRTGAVLGTPMFMAPEQIRNSADVDARADVFALGCLIYQLLCGSPAFRGIDLIELYSQMEASNWRPVRDWMPSVPQRMEKAIIAALEPDRANRPADARALLALWVDGTPAPAPSGVWEQEHMDFIKRLAPSAGGEAPGATLAAPAAPSVEGGGTLAEQGSATWAEDEEPSKKRGGLALFLASSGVAVVLLGVGTLLLLLVVGVLWMRPWESAPVVAEVPELADIIDEPVDTGVEVVMAPEDPAPTTTDAATAPTTRRNTTRRGAGTSTTPIDAPVETPPAAVAGSSTATVDPKPTSSTSGTAVASATTWSATGAHEAWLVASSGKRFRPGVVPPGRYSAEVRFDAGSEPTAVMTVQVTKGSATALKCVAALKSCVLK